MKGVETGMSVFIHTFSLQKKESFDRAEKIWTYYNNENISKEEGILVNHFAKEGLRIQMRYRSDEEVRYDKEHKKIKIELVITPYKLIHPGEDMGKILKYTDMDRAIKRLFELLEEIKRNTEIDLSEDLQVNRVDITKDIITPSQIYTKEIIAVCKATSLPRGYHFCNPSKMECIEKGWNPKNACLYQNKNQDVKVKIYDKQQNLMDYGKLDSTDVTENGLIRFEISLGRKFLKKNGFMKEDTFLDILYMVLKKGDQLFRSHFLIIMDQGQMLSFTLLEKYIKRKKKKRPSDIEKMLIFAKVYNGFRKHGEEFQREKISVSDKVYYKLKEKYHSLDLSPIPLADECPYIPSFTDLFGGTMDLSVVKFVINKTRGKEIWSYAAE